MAPLVVRGAVIVMPGSSHRHRLMCDSPSSESRCLARASLGACLRFPTVLLGPQPGLWSTTDAFTAAGFRIAVISEPYPAQDTPGELLPDFLAGKPSGTFLAFLFFVLEAG
jgi:hypothetical protein